MASYRLHALISQHLPVRVIWEACAGLVCRHLELIKHEERVQVAEPRGSNRPADVHAWHDMAWWKGGAEKGESVWQQWRLSPGRRSQQQRLGRHCQQAGTGRKQHQLPPAGAYQHRRWQHPPAPSIIFWPRTTALMGRTSAWEAALVMLLLLLSSAAGVGTESWPAESCARSRRAAASRGRQRARASVAVSRPAGEDDESAELMM